MGVMNATHPLTQEFAREIGADDYAADAGRAGDTALELLQGKAGEGN